MDLMKWSVIIQLITHFITSEQVLNVNVGFHTDDPVEVHILDAKPMTIGPTCRFIQLAQCLGRHENARSIAVWHDAVFGW